MPKNSSIDVLKRWMALDGLLTGRGEHTARLKAGPFAKKWGVSEKTVRRDLLAFKEMGQEIRQCQFEGDRAPRWYYPNGVQPLFSKNAKEWWKKYWYDEWVTKKRESSKH